MKTKSLLFSCFLTMLLAFSASSASAQCQAGFTYTVSGPNVTFTNTSTTAGMPLCIWNFGDNTSTYSVAPAGVTHAYNTAGTFYVCVTLTDSMNQSCTSVFCDSVAVNVGCNGLSATVTSTAASTCSACDGTASATATGGTAPYYYSWSNATTTPSLINLCPGYYSLMVADANGCTTSTGATVTCPTSCHSGFTSSVSGNTVYVNNTSNDTSSNVQFTWYFGDSNYSSLVNPGSHTYASPGSYTIILLMSDFLNSCSDTTYSTVTVGGPSSCSAGFAMLQDSFNLLQWYAYTSVTGVAPFTYTWDFGDNTTSTLQYPTHTYSTPGQYTVCLTIVDANGCTSTYCDSSSVHRSSSSLQMQYFTAVDPATATGIQQQSEFTGHSWPNPATDVMNISFSMNVDGVIRVTDLTGKTIAEQKINGRRATIDMSNLPAGIYNLSLSNESVKWNEKVVVIH